MNEKAKKYIEDNTLDLNKNERMDTNWICIFSGVY